MRRSLLALTALAASIVPAGPARADEKVAALARPTPVSALDGRVVWSEYDVAQSAYYLTQHMNGVTSRLPLRPRAVPFDVDLGPDADGRTVATYSRCRREPPAREARTGNIIAIHLFAWSRARGCDIYMFAFETGAEVRVRYASTRGASEFLPTVWTDRIAFARVFERRRSRAGRRAYLYLRPNSLMARNGPRGRSQRVPAGPRGRGRFCRGRPRRCQRLEEPGPTALDLRTRRLAFGWDSVRFDPTSAIYIDTLHVGRRTGRRRIELVGSGNVQASELLAPQFDQEGHLVWIASLYGHDTASFVRRYRVPGGDRDQALIPPPPGESLFGSVLAGSIDEAAFLYLGSGLNPGDPCSPQSPCNANPGCSESEPCQLRRTTELVFRPL
jgi:hypothetical protein